MTEGNSMSTLTAPAGTPLVVPTFTGEYYWLSNFFPRSLRFRVAGQGPDAFGLEFPMSEHAYQAGKAHAMVDKSRNARADYILSIRAEPDPTRCKHIARKVQIDVDLWDSMKDAVMREVVFEKFLQHTDLRSNLLDTGTAMLVEGNTWGDKYWGRVDGKGLNHLGVILMETRGYFHFVDRNESLRANWLRPPLANLPLG